MGENRKFSINFLGIGAEKAASYWVWYILREHPEICFSRRKELQFFNEFDQHFLKIVNPRFFRGISWYKDRFIHCPEGKIIGEYTPTYLYSRKSAERIKKLFPSVKLIVVLRDPVTRAFSQYIHDKSIGVIGNISFEEALRRHDCYVEKGMYYKYLRHYFKLFPKQNIFIATTDDIKKDSRRVVKELYYFLALRDVDYIPKSLNAKPNKASQSRFPFLNRLLIQAEYFILRTKLYRLHQFLEDTNLRRFAFNTTYFKNRNPIKNYPVMNKETETILRKKFIKDIEKLEKLLRRKFIRWKKSSEK